MNVANTPILSIVTFLPLVGALLIAFQNREAAGNARWIALWTTLVTFAVSLLIWINFDKGSSASSSSRRRLGSARSSTSSESTASRCCS